jgi:hypothetical protein
MINEAIIEYDIIIEYETIREYDIIVNKSMINEAIINKILFIINK